MIFDLSAKPNPDHQRIRGHRLGFETIQQSPVSAIMALSYQPDMTNYSGCPVAAVLAEIGGAKYDQFNILDLVESDNHNRITLSKALLDKYGKRPYSAVYADLETLKWLNQDQLFIDMAVKAQSDFGWNDYPGVMAVGIDQLKDSASQQAKITAWQSTILDQIESMRDSNGKPVLRYTPHLKNNNTIMSKFSLRGKSTAVMSLAVACHVMLSIVDDLRWEYLPASMRP